MSFKLKLLIVLGIILFNLVLAILIKKDKLPMKYALIWIISSFVVFLIPVFPRFFTYVSNKLGFQALSSMLIVMFIGILMLITLFLTIIVSSQNKKIIRLTQDISLEKKEWEMIE